MSFDLINKLDSRVYLHMNNNAWFFLLDAARAFGWKPKGTVNPLYGNEGGGDWSGDYCFNNFQTVTEDDVLELVAALERFLVELPDLVKSFDAVKCHGLSGFLYLDNYQDRFCGLVKHLNSCIEFFRRGSFIIG